MLVVNGFQVGVVALGGRGASRCSVDGAVGCHAGILDGVEAVLISWRLAMAQFSEMSKAEPRPHSPGVVLLLDVLLHRLV